MSALVLTACLLATQAPVGLDEPPDDGHDDETLVTAKSRARQKEESAETVQVLDVAAAHGDSSSLAALLRRSRGVGVRQAGGLGSHTELSLGGLVDDQVRVFVDGVPFEIAGYGTDVGNVPIGLVQAVDVYQGVVPLRFGSDALGGAIDLVTNARHPHTGASGGLSLGSFRTARAHVSARALHDDTGAWIALDLFSDRSANDALVHVEVPNEVGRPRLVVVPRFHDAYGAWGAAVELGAQQEHDSFVRLRLHRTHTDRDVQHSAVSMTVPFGEVTTRDVTSGATLVWRAPVAGVQLDAVAAYALLSTAVLDMGTRVWSWFGEPGLVRARPGEMGAATDVQLLQHTVFTRLGSSLPVPCAGCGVLEVSTTVTGTTHLSNDLRHPHDAQSLHQGVLALTTGVSHTLDAFDDAVQNAAFAKAYAYQASSIDEPVLARPRLLHARATHLGVGEGLRVRLGESHVVKASYEWSMRAPTPQELFGDGVFVQPNLQLAPERSHNLNLGGVSHLRGADVVLTGELLLLARFAQDLIVQLATDRARMSDNVAAARVLGVQAELGAATRDDVWSASVNATFLDVRNTAADGAFGAYAGDRVPNRPYAFANAQVQWRSTTGLLLDDNLSVAFRSQAVQAFFRSWESVGRPDTKAVIPAQLVHGLSVTYALGNSGVTVSAEVQNATNARAFDFFGIERPGRALFCKITSAI